MTNNNLLSTPPHSMPFNHDVERALLGCILYNSAIFDEVLFAGITEQHFFSQRHRAIFNACKLLCEKRQGYADTVTVAEYIQGSDDNDLFENDVNIYCQDLVEKAVSPSAWKSYATSLNRLQKRRSIIRLADKAKQAAFEIDESEDVETLVSEVSEGFFKEEMKVGGSLTNVQALEIKLKEWNDAVAGIKTAYPCYLRDVESLLGGFVKGKPYFIAAPPADGKSTFMVNQAEAWARSGIKVALASLEMEHSELMGILAAKIAEESAFSLRTAYGGKVRAQCRLDAVYQKALPQMTETSDVMSNIKISEDQMNIDELCAWIRYMKHREDVKVVMIDYLQIIQPSRGFKGSTREMINDIVNKLKIVAKETGITIITLSQLTKDARKGERRPHKADLKESGTIEEVAYGVILLYYWEDLFYADLAKNRGGLTGVVEIEFDKSKQHIKDKEQGNGTQKENSDSRTPYAD